jgi:hypothetical protein
VTTPDDELLLHDLLDGRLAGADRARAQARVEQEPLLREAYDELLRTRELVRAGPGVEAPPDFVARVRARLAVEDAAGSARVGAASPPSIPPAWRRVMVAAYALAALLVVAVGVISLRRGQERGAAPIEDARAAAEPAAADPLEMKTELKREVEKAALAPAELPPMRGPRGSVQPGLRAPFDAPRAADAAPAADAPPPAALGAPKAAAPAPTAAPAPASRVMADVYVLEAESAEVGRKLVEQVLSGPKEARDAQPGYTAVALRRAHLDTDRALLVRLGIVATESGGAPASPPSPRETVHVIADFSRALGAAELGRLETLVGAPPAAPSPPAPAARPSRLVRFIVLAPPTPR